jgi:hypothetical protein
MVNVLLKALLGSKLLDETLTQVEGWNYGKSVENYLEESTCKTYEIAYQVFIFSLISMCLSSISDNMSHWYLYYLSFYF